MKKYIVGFLLTLSFQHAAEARPVIVWPNCFYGYSNYCTIRNPDSETINCTIQAQGRTAAGQYVSGFQFATIQPGMISWLYIYGNAANDPVQYLTANAFCNTQI